MHSLEKNTRQVLLLEGETSDSLQRSPGEVKENIPTRNIALMTLSRNQLLAIGEVRLQTVLSAGGTPSGSPEASEGRRRIPARVVRGGLIRRGEQIELL